MSAFVAELIFRIECQDVRTVQYEEQWRMVFSESRQEALELARALGKEEEAVFPDRLGRLVNWQFVAVKSLEEVDLQQGALLFSSVKELETIANPEWTALSPA